MRKIIVSLLFVFVLISAVSSKAEEKKATLVFVGDATLTYANYFFLLPSDWIPLAYQMELTQKVGFWWGRHKDDETLIEIKPMKKVKGLTLASIVNAAREISEKESPLGSWKEYSNFKPNINYAYESYTFNHLQKGTYELFVFVELPSEYVISFILTAYGKEEESIIRHLDDFNKLISSFRWILGLSNVEISNMLKKIK